MYGRPHRVRRRRGLFAIRPIARSLPIRAWGFGPEAASAFGYVLKPFHIRNLIVAIEVAVDRFEMERRLEDSQLTYATNLGSIADGVIAVAGSRPIHERGWPSV
jgi:hypothetical protein